MTHDEIGHRLVAGQWVLPHFAERRLGRGTGEPVVSLGDVAFPQNVEPRWSVIGAVGSAGRAAIDSRGMLTPRPGGWSVDWCVGAEDRWHLPSRERAVVQDLFEGVPIVETSMKIPGGQAVHRAFAAAGSPPAAVVEVENASPAPFALALSIRPFDQTAVTPIRTIEVDGTWVSVDGRPALALPGPPSRTAVSTFDRGDCLSAVVRGDAGDAQNVRVEDAAAVATAAVIVPVPHRATARVAVPLGHPSTDGAWPARFATVGDVARGWGLHLAGGMRVALPDERAQRVVDAARAQLMLLDDGVEVTPVPWAGGERRAEDVVAVLTALRRWGFERHADEVGASVSRRWLRKHRPTARRGRDAWQAAETLLDRASPTFGWSVGETGYHGRPLADFLLMVRDGLIAEDEDGVAMLPAIPPAWRGRPLEVRDAPTAFGRVSFAVRWHGERPALLWEGENRHRFRAPGLDPRWSSAESRGEVLLEG